MIALDRETVTVILARHGQVSWNIERRFLGHRDLPLTEEGIRQAEKLAHRLGREPALARAYSSDLERAAATARKVAEVRGIEVIESNDLRELDFGDWEGLTFDEIKKGWGPLLDLWLDDPFKYRPPGGESLGQLLGRTEGAMKRIIGANPGKTVLVVSHGGPIRLLTCLYMGWPLGDFWSVPHRHAAISVFRFCGNVVTPVTLNDTAHLR